VTRTLALAHRRLGDVLAQTGDVAMALRELQASNALYATIAAGPAAALGDRIEAGIAAVKLGDVLGNPNFQNLGRTADADRQYAIALDAFRRLYRTDATDMRVRRYLALTLERIGTMHEQARRWQQAAAAYEESFTIRRALAADEPMHQNIQRDLAIAYEKLGKVHQQTDGPAAAAGYFRQALSTFERLAAADPSNENAARTVAISREQLADTAIALGTTDQAIALFRQALATHRAIVAHDDRNVRAKCDAARVAESLGDALMTERRRVTAAACAEWQAGLDLHQRLAAAGASACAPAPAIGRLTQKRRAC
jgi:tetratricopeptide (TPR) repeat protein